MATSKHETRFELTATDKTKVAIKSAQSGFDQLNGMVGKLTAGFGLLAGAGGVGMLITKQVEGARQAVAYADALQVPLDTLTAMQAAGEVVGIGSDKLADILKDTAEKIADAYRNQGGEAVEVLEGLGLNIAHINSLSPDRQLLAIADALGQVGSQGEKIQILEALASDASLLLPLLDDNAARLKDLMEQADATGKTLTRIEADKLQELDEAMRSLDMATEGFAQTLASEFAPAATIAINSLNGLTGALDWYLDKVTSGLGAGYAGIYELIFGGDAVQAGMDIELRLKAQEYAQKWEEELAKAREEARKNSGGMVITVDDSMQNALEKLRQKFRTENEIILEDQQIKLEQLDAFKNAELLKDQEYNELRTRIVADAESRQTAITEQEAQKRSQIEARVQGQINSLKMQGLSIAVGLLRQLGQEHDGAAYAAIALEKVMALAQIETSTAAALAGANTLYAMGPAGPGAVAAAKADILSSAAFARGMVIASGIVDAYAVGNSSSGISPTGAATPVAPIDNNLQPFPGSSEPTAQQGNQVTILIKGDGKFTELVRDSIEVLSDNDELIMING